MKEIGRASLVSETFMKVELVLVSMVIGCEGVAIGSIREVASHAQLTPRWTKRHDILTCWRILSTHSPSRTQSLAVSSACSATKVDMSDSHARKNARSESEATAHFMTTKG